MSNELLYAEARRHCTLHGGRRRCCKQINGQKSARLALRLSLPARQLAITISDFLQTLLPLSTAIGPLFM
jgi:hypothetical protein